MINKEEQFTEGIVVEALPNTLFNVELVSDNESDEKKKHLVYLSGKMRIHRIKVLVGDKVKIKLDSYGGRGRIVQRLR
ncbi:MAG: translation initiation factor IF-1 [Candidatus Pacebacteria bacterium]|nr:translation initiation factor IF-1 [Candidatus Paceibacterota bacterium]